VRGRAAVRVTFDNLGEVTDLERGVRPDDEPLGQHFSVTRTLPRILDLLNETGLRATFFVEGRNTELYPGTLREIAAAGHEVAYHGWCHERWADLSPSEERDLLERGARRMGELGLRPVGFRPPGGRLTRASLCSLREVGFTYCSPAGEAVDPSGGVVVLPFRWPLVDAFYYLPHFGDLRKRVVGSSDVLPPSRLREAVTAALEDTVRHTAYVALLFHPFLAEPEDRFEVVRGLLGSVRALFDDGAVWCAPCRDIAASARRC
jgi:peptidoglycan/xylan/chitin deacetylase (PgdA/CDA1 family)